MSKNRKRKLKKTMDEKSFVYWLNGFFELSNAQTLDCNQIEIIKEHLALVLNKVTKTNNVVTQKPILSPQQKFSLDELSLTKTRC